MVAIFACAAGHEQEWGRFRGGEMYQAVGHCAECGRAAVEEFGEYAGAGQVALGFVRYQFKDEGSGRPWIMIPPVKKLKPGGRSGSSRR